MTNNVIYVNADPRFVNPFGGDTQKFYDWAVDQDELIQLIHYLNDQGFKFVSKDGSYYGRHVEAIYKLMDLPRVPEPVYVFGSNEGGIHGAGQARLAKLHYGAIVGQGVGLQGNSYGIPTKSKFLEVLSLDEISVYVDEFVEFAAAHPGLQFCVQRIGTGLSGYRQDQIAPLFKKAEEKLPKKPTNIDYPYNWYNESPAHWILAGSRHTEIKLAMELFASVEDFVNDPHAVVISGSAWGADRAGEQYAIDNGLAFKRFPAFWERFGKAAGYIRNYQMDHVGTHLIAAWDGQSRGTMGMIDSARNSGINTVIRLTR